MTCNILIIVAADVEIEQMFNSAQNICHYC